MTSAAVESPRLWALARTIQKSHYLRVCDGIEASLASLGCGLDPPDLSTPFRRPVGKALVHTD